MTTFLQVSLLLGLMVVVILAGPAIASQFFGGIVSGLTALALLVLFAILFLGLAIVGGGTAAVVGLAMLLALGCVVVAVLLPIAVPILILAALIVLPIKLARRLSRPTVAA